MLGFSFFPKIVLGALILTAIGFFSWAAVLAIGTTENPSVIALLVAMGFLIVAGALWGASEMRAHQRRARTMAMVETFGAYHPFAGVALAVAAALATRVGVDLDEVAAWVETASGGAANGRTQHHPEPRPANEQTPETQTMAKEPFKSTVH